MTIEEQIEDNKRAIDKIQKINTELQKKLEEEQLLSWEPDNGNYKINLNGAVVESTPVISHRDFGTSRLTIHQAKMARGNMKKFNRLSCFMKDTNPIMEFTDISVSLTFYDYEKTSIELLKKIVQSKGSL